MLGLKLIQVNKRVPRNICFWIHLKRAMVAVGQCNFSKMKTTVKHRITTCVYIAYKFSVAKQDYRSILDCISNRLFISETTLCWRNRICLLHTQCFSDHYFSICFIRKYISRYLWQCVAMLNPSLAKWAPDTLNAYLWNKQESGVTVILAQGTGV